MQSFSNNRPFYIIPYILISDKYQALSSARSELLVPVVSSQRPLDVLCSGPRTYSGGLIPKTAAAAASADLLQPPSVFEDTNTQHR